MRLPKFLLPLGFALTTGCSFLFDLSSDQCQAHSDCDALGGAFTGRQCVAGVCEGCKSNSSCETARGEGYVCKKPSGQSVGVCKLDSTPVPSASMSMESGVEAGPSETGPDVECTTNQDCINENAASRICKNNTCLDLVTHECPVVLEAQNLTETDPIIIGAYSAISSTAPLTGPITMNYRLALREFSGKGGLPGGKDGKQRGFVAVVCEGRGLTDSPIETSLNHLINVVGVPGIVASMYYTEDLRKAFNETAKPADVFFIDPLYADSSLTNQNNNGLLWFILGEWRALAHSYVELTKRAETFQKMRSGDTEVRVALVQGALTGQKDTGSVLLADETDHLVFNGGGPVDEVNTDNFQVIQLTADFASTSSEIASVLGALDEFKPHVIVLTAGTEFITKVIPALESNWVDETETDGQIRPFYVMSPDMAFEPGLKSAVYDDVLLRSAGVNFEGYIDRTLYGQYKFRYQAEFGPDFPEDTENFYDAMYYLLYAIAAAGTPAKLDGDAIALGMQRITSRNSMSYSVGPDKISDTLVALQVQSNKINLMGTMGPSNFYPNGSREVQGSVWCMKPGESPVFNVLRVDTDGELTGTFPCFDDF